MTEERALLAGGCAACRAAARHRVGRRSVPHLPIGEQPGDRGQPAERDVDGLVGPVPGARQRGIDAFALGVEQDRILEGRWKHASLLEPDDEHERTAGETGGRE